MTNGPSTPVEELAENMSPLFARTRLPKRCTAIRGRQILASVSVTLRDALGGTVADNFLRVSAYRFVTLRKEMH